MKLTEAAAEALPLLVRARCLDAIQLAQSAEGGPVTSEIVRTRMRPPVAASAKGFTSLLRRIEALGPDATGRRLAGDVDRIGAVRWWVESPDPRQARIAALAGELAEPGEDLSAVVLRALQAVTQAPAAAHSNEPPPAPALKPPAAAPISETEPDPSPNETAPPAEPPQEPRAAVTELPDQESAAPAPPVEGAPPAPAPDTLEALFGLASVRAPVPAPAPAADGAEPLHLKADVEW